MRVYTASIYRGSLDRRSRYQDAIVLTDLAEGRHWNQSRCTFVFEKERQNLAGLVVLALRPTV
jgi:hypothetical protein